MAKTVELLLVESVDSLGIVGDVVKVRTGFARNYLLPRSLATTPSEELIKQLAAKRADAQRQIAEQRSQREQMVAKLEGVEITLERSCNDQGHLYGSVTQQDIATALVEAGFAVRARDVRLGQPIKRVDTYEVTVRPDVDLEASVKLWVVSDRPLAQDERRESEEPAPAATEGAPAGAEAPDAGEKAEPAGRKGAKKQPKG
ncbi:MAG TPA: 50S ribosomal protein L9 [Phycisphaerales bacterium]|nr:50S ribosomal protein L9 [Phycisphaerales bacterium]